MNNRSRFKSSLGFTDLLFNLLVGFVFLFVVAFILINPPVKKSDAPKKAEFLIVMEWHNMSSDDMDMWVQDPNGETTSFTNKHAGLLNLEKDDLGISNDLIRDPVDGTYTVLRLNREVVTIRGTVPGRYQVAAHVYSYKPTQFDKDGEVIEKVNFVKITVIKLNPYKEEIIIERPYELRGQVLPMVNFTIDDDGNVTDWDEEENNIVFNRAVQRLPSL